MDDPRVHILLLIALGLVCGIFVVRMAHAQTPLIEATQESIADLQHTLAQGCKQFFARDLSIGTSGSDVVCLQQILLSQGESIPFGATGYFGSQTLSALKGFQLVHKISPPAGYFGPITRRAFVNL